MEENNTAQTQDNHKQKFDRDTFAGLTPSEKLVRASMLVNEMNSVALDGDDPSEVTPYAIECAFMALDAVTDAMAWCTVANLSTAVLRTILIAIGEGKDGQQKAIELAHSIEDEGQKQAELLAKVYGSVKAQVDGLRSVAEDMDGED